MQTKLTTALAILLLAGASGAAMAQEHDHGDHGDRGQAQPQGHPQAAPQAQPQHAGPPPGGGQRGPSPGERGGPPNGGFHGRDGQERGPQGPAPAAPHQHFNRDAGQAPGAPRPFDRDRGGRERFDRQRGPSEVIPPGAERGREVAPGPRGDGRVDGRGGRDGHFEGRADGRGDGRGGQFFGPRNAPTHWQAGRFPPVLQAHDRFRTGRYRAPYGYYARAWGFGDFLPRPWFARDYWLDDFLDFDLPYPPPGFVWVRVGPDALMIDRFTGRVVQVVRDIFW